MSAAPPEDLRTVLCRLAAEATSLATWRQAALDALASFVRFDAALFHELSPRVPLDRAGIVGFDRDAIAATRSQWDDHAISLGAFTIRALAQGGVATDREAFGDRGRGRTAWNRHVARPLGIRSALAAHLVLDAEIVSMVLLARRADPGFSSLERERVAPLLPVLSICNGWQLSKTASTVTGMAIGVRCVDERLTPRQRELVEHVALGRTNAEVGRALGISANTVRNTLATIRARVGAANRADLVRLAVLHPRFSPRPEAP
ncbi:MAG: helix-turn-helix transcriptional regulator [Sandaracinaceae bacterium]|nr:helix-turn-helix transcriptional regulator [Sandaracinaceae bacterium]